MSDIHIKFSNKEKKVVMAVKRETVIQALETIQKVAQGISAITPTTVDDEIVKILDLVVTEDWFVDLLMLAIGLLSKTGC